MNYPFRQLPVAVLLLFVACSEQAPMGPEGSPNLPAAVAGPSVTATDPTGTEQGVTLDVRVLGSGFDNGSSVTLLLNGVPNSKVRTNNTRYVSAKELVANITVALDAVTDAYDVLVTTTRGKKGIGTEMFEIRTIATLGTLGGSTSFAEAINAGGVVTGGSLNASGYSAPYVWSEAAGMQALPTLPGFVTGAGRDINDANVIAGESGQRLVRWVPAGSGWTIEALGGFGDGTGYVGGINAAGTIVGGSPNPAGVTLPFRWDEGPGMTALPLPAAAQRGRAEGINTSGTSVGWVGYVANPGRGEVDNSPVAWTASGGVTLLPVPIGFNNSIPAAINDQGVIAGIVSYISSRNRDFKSWAVRWLPDPASPGQWLPPELLFQLPRFAMILDIDEVGRIVGYVSDQPGSRAIMWQAGIGVTELGGLSKTSLAHARQIRETAGSGPLQVVGLSDGSSIPTQAVLWTLP
jgi:hypothetical protein